MLVFEQARGRCRSTSAAAAAPSAATAPEDGLVHSDRRAPAGYRLRPRGRLPRRARRSRPKPPAPTAPASAPATSTSSTGPTTPTRRRCAGCRSPARRATTDDDWESVQFRIGPDGSVDERASSHHGYNYVLSDNRARTPARPQGRGRIVGARDDGWGPETHLLLVSGGSHAGNAPARRHRPLHPRPPRPPGPARADRRRQHRRLRDLAALAEAGLARSGGGGNQLIHRPGSHVVARVSRIPAEVSSVSKAAIAEALSEARERTLALVEPLDDEQLNRVYSPILSPLAWDLGHIANFEELWLVQTIGGREPLHGELGRFYDAIENPRKIRGELPILRDEELRAYMADVRERTLDVLEGWRSVPSRGPAAAGRLRLRDAARPRAAAQRDDAAAAAAGRGLRAAGRSRGRTLVVLVRIPGDECVRGGRDGRDRGGRVRDRRPRPRLRLRQRAPASHRRPRRLRDRPNPGHQRRVHRLHGGDRRRAAAVLGARRERAGSTPPAAAASRSTPPIP